MKQTFVHLHVHSTYSSFDGMTPIPDLFTKCEQLRMPGVALTDHGNMRGMQEFFSEAERHPSVKPIAGCEFYITDHFNHNLKDAEHKRVFHLILLAKNEVGYRNLFRLMLAGYKEGYYRRRPRISHELLAMYHEGLICTSACIGGEVAQALLNEDTTAAEKAAVWYKNLFGDDFYLEVDLHPNDIESRIYPLQQEAANCIFLLGNRLGIKVVAANDIHFLEAKDAAMHDLMLCMNTGCNPSDKDRFRYTGEEYLKSYEQMQSIFEGHKDALENTLEVLNKVSRYSLPNVTDIIREYQ